MFEKEEKIKLLHSRVGQMGGELIKFKEGKTGIPFQGGISTTQPAVADIKSSRFRFAKQCLNAVLFAFRYRSVSTKMIEG